MKFTLSWLKEHLDTEAGLDELVARFERGEFDLVAVGRALLSDPHWVRKVREGRSGELRGFEPEHAAALA